MKRILVAFLVSCLVFTTSLAVEGTNKTIRLNKVIEDSISEKGEIDYFNFSISKPGSLQIRFDFDIQGSYTIKLVDTKTGKVVQTSPFSSNVNTTNGRYEKFANKIRLDDGDYQIQVSCGYFSNCDEDYELEVIYDQESGDRYEKEPNNTAKTAMIIDYNRSVVGNLESTSDVDYYMVEIPYNGELYTELEFNNDATYNVEIFSENNGTLKSISSKKYEAKLNQSSDTYFDISDKVRVPAGNYYFKVSKNWSNFSNEDYILCVRFSGNSYGHYETESNDEAKSSNEIIPDVEYVGNLSSNRDVDFYRVSFWEDTKFTIKMNVPSEAQYTITTYKNVNGDLSQLKTETFASKDLVNLIVGNKQEVTAGDYYFKVASRTYSNKDYTFLVEAESIRSYENKTTIVLEINNPYMLVNNATYPIDGNRGTAPVIVNSRTLLPARAIIEALGGNVTWIESSKGININLDGKNVYLTLDSALAYVNGAQKWLDVAPTSINGRTMVPVKFVMDNLGGSVIWNATTGTVTITY